MDVVLFFMNVYQQACIHLLNFANKIDSIYLILLEKQPALKWFNHLSVSKIQGGSLIRIVQLLQLKFKKKKEISNGNATLCDTYLLCSFYICISGSIKLILQGKACLYRHIKTKSKHHYQQKFSPGPFACHLDFHLIAMQIIFAVY